MAEGGQSQNSVDADVMPTSLSSGTSGSAILAEGGNVSLKIANSTVNVVTGDQINANKVVFNITGAEGGATPTNQDISYGRVIQICNENTKNLTAIDILEDFRLEDLREPNFEVYPQMRKVDVEYYYKGHYGNTSFQRAREINDHNQLTQEVGFFNQDNIGVIMIGIDDVMASVWQREKASSSKPIGVTAIVASAGSGKSTLTRRIARQALGMSAIDDVEDLISYDNKMVHHIELKDIPERSEIKPAKFLFGGLYRSEEEEDLAFEWLDEHQSDATLILDGLDQATWNFDGKNPRKIRKYDKASSWTIMYNILSRNILRQVKIFIASREFKVSELPAPARPETILTLNGLTLEDAHRLFAFLLKEKGEVVWQKIQHMSPRLLNLVSVPVFLILTAVVMGRDPTGPPPSTVTELYNRIILALQSVENIRNRVQILSIVNKLKALAFQGMKEGRVVFKDTDLKLFEVSTEEVQDLMTKVPGNNLLSRHLMQGDFSFFFCHQSLQEYLAAIFITEMEFSKFSLFDEEHLHEERWSVVRRFVAGVVFAKSQNDLYRVPDQTDKQQVFARSIRSQLEKNKDTSRILMEVYTTIYESDDDNLMKHLSFIDVSGISLSRDQAHIVKTLAARSQNLDLLRLRNCSIDEELWGIIARCPIHVKCVDLRDSNISVTALRSFLGHRRVESLSGNLDWEVVELSVDVFTGYCQSGVQPFITDLLRLKKGEDVIGISGKTFKGHFNIKDSNVSFETVLSVDSALAVGKVCEKLSDVGFVRWKNIEELSGKVEDLRKIKEYKLEKISKILLDCTEDDNIDWLLIETSLKQYHVDLLDIAVNGQISADDYNRILEHRRAISVFGNIHAMFYIGGENDFKQIQEALQQKKIEYIRCIFNYRCCSSLDEISSLVNKSNLKKVTLINQQGYDTLEEDELQKVQKIANDLELESLNLDREADVWKMPEETFRDSERRRRWMQKR